LIDAAATYAIGVRLGRFSATMDLSVGYHYGMAPGRLRAEGRVVHRTKRTVFCAAELRDADGNHLASARCTQVLRQER
jgi:uncharacterized protein (TIGR00369 family)